MRAIADAIHPEYRAESPALHLATQLDAPRSCPHRYVALDAATQQVIGYGASWIWKPPLPRYRLDLMVHPAWRRRGVGNLLLSGLLDDLGALSAATLQARVRDDQPESLAFLQQRGFVPVQRMHALALDVAAADLTSLASRVARLKARGIEITTLERLRRDDGDFLPKLLALYNAVLPDWPDPDPTPFVPIAAADFARRLGLEMLRADAFFVAVQHGQLVGFSDLDGFGTAVHPDFRRLGVATALKSHVVADARHRGYARLFTCTAHPAMRAVNENLGYRVVRSEIRLIARLR